MTTCRYRYGARRQLVCQLPAGHRGPHAARRNVWQLARSLGGTWRTTR